MVGEQIFFEVKRDGLANVESLNENCEIIRICVEKQFAMLDQNRWSSVLNKNP